MMRDPRDEREPSEDELREDDVTAADRLDDRVDEEQDEDATVHTERDDLLPPADAPPNV